MDHILWSFKNVTGGLNTRLGSGLMIHRIKQVLKNWPKFESLQWFWLPTMAWALPIRRRCIRIAKRPYEKHFYVPEDRELTLFLSRSKSWFWPKSIHCRRRFATRRSRPTAHRTSHRWTGLIPVDGKQMKNLQSHKLSIFCIFPIRQSCRNIKTLKIMIKNQCSTMFAQDNFVINFRQEISATGLLPWNSWEHFAILKSFSKRRSFRREISEV